MNILTDLGDTLLSKGYLRLAELTGPDGGAQSKKSFSTAKARKSLLKMLIISDISHANIV